MNVSSGLTITQALAVAATVNEATAWCNAGWVTAHLSITLNAFSGAAGFAITISAPALPPPKNATAGNTCGQFLYTDASGGLYWGSVTVDTASTLTFFAATGSSSQIGASPSFATASGDKLTVDVRYPHA